MDSLQLAREAVIRTYNQDGYYNHKMLAAIRSGEYDDTFAIRAARNAADKMLTTKK